MKAKCRLYWKVTKEVVNWAVPGLVFFLALGALGMLGVAAFGMYFEYAYDQIGRWLVSAGALAWPAVFRGPLQMVMDVILPFATAIGVMYSCVLLFMGVLGVLDRIRSVRLRPPSSCLLA